MTCFSHTNKIASLACGYTSRRTLLHFYKNTMTESFRKFDYGPRGNMEVYGQLEPPRYLLEKVTVPVATYRGPGDQLTAQEVKGMIFYVRQIFDMLSYSISRII